MQASVQSKNPNMIVEFLGSQTVALTPKAGWQAYSAKKGKTKATGALERGLAQAAASKGLVAVVNVPPEAIQLAQQGLKDAPPFFAAFLKTKSVLASVDLTTKLNLKAALIMENEAAATEAKQAADGLVGFAGLMLGGMAKDPEMADLVKLGQQALKDLKIAAKGDELNLAFDTDVGQLAEKVMPIVMKIQAAAGNAQESNNLKQIGIAWHVHHDVNKGLPPQTVGKGLSWRVAILPYIEQDNLYKMFNLNEPWDSPTNKKLIPLMPKTYESVGKKAPPGFTYYQTFLGPNTINKNPMKGMMLQQFADGTSNTLIVAEAAQPVEWTKPADIQVTPNQPVTLGGSTPGATFVIFADGRVQRISQKLDQKVLHNLIDPADGNPIPSLDGAAAPGGELSAPPKTGNVPPTTQVESKVSAFPKKAELPLAQPKEAGKPSPAPRVVSIARGKRGDLGNGQKLLANLPNENVVVLKLDGVPAALGGREILLGATYKAGGANRTFNTVTVLQRGGVWVGGAVPNSATTITIMLPGNVAPFTVDLPAEVADEVKGFD